jgi:hypothetical protein
MEFDSLTRGRGNFCTSEKSSILCFLLFVFKKSFIEFCHLVPMKHFVAHPRLDYHTSPMRRIPVPATITTLFYTKIKQTESEIPQVIIDINIRNQTLWQKSTRSIYSAALFSCPFDPFSSRPSHVCTICLIDLFI